MPKEANFLPHQLTDLGLHSDTDQDVFCAVVS